MNKKYAVFKKVGKDWLLIASCAYAYHADMIWEDCKKRWPKEQFIKCLS